MMVMASNCTHLVVKENSKVGFSLLSPEYGPPQATRSIAMPIALLLGTRPINPGQSEKASDLTFASKVLVTCFCDFSPILDVVASTNAGRVRALLFVVMANNESKCRC